MTDSILKHTARGAAVGLLATAPMSAVILGAEPFFPAHAERRLPPEQITQKLMQKAGLNKLAKGRKLDAMAVTSHFGYGAAMGALYSVIGAQATTRPFIAGASYGMGVWALGYAGYLPLFHLQPKPQHQPRGRNTAMIAAHLVWGISLAYLANALAKPSMPPEQPLAK